MQEKKVWTLIALAGLTALTPVPERRLCFEHFVNNLQELGDGKQERSAGPRPQRSQSKDRSSAEFQHGARPARLGFPVVILRLGRRPPTSKLCRKSATRQRVSKRISLRLRPQKGSMP
jgi:hypothetical protein